MPGGDKDRRPGEWPTSPFGLDACLGRPRRGALQSARNRQRPSVTSRRWAGERRACPRVTRTRGPGLPSCELRGGSAPSPRSRGAGMARSTGGPTQSCSKHHQAAAVEDPLTAQLRNRATTELRNSANLGSSPGDAARGRAGMGPGVRGSANAGERGQSGAPRRREPGRGVCSARGARAGPAG